MFTILGSDGKEYGPISADQLGQWIREGRAGGFTQIRREGEVEWSLLRSAPEFADVFQTPPMAGNAGDSRALPPVVRLFAFGFFIAAAISALFMLFSVVTILLLPSRGSFHLGAMVWISWGIGFLGLPIRVVCGMGLLRTREWARKLAIGYAAIMVLYGGWGILQTFRFLTGAGDLLMILRSPTFVLSNLWGVALLAFNIATVFVLCRGPVRATFAASRPAV